MSTLSPRNLEWLEIRLTELWETYFHDVYRESNLIIRFGPRTASRLGSIKRRQGQTIITVTGHFRHREIPDYVIDETITHELTHYTHGFESPLPRLYHYPHEGSIVRQELRRRGLGSIHLAARRWLKTHWRTYLRSLHQTRQV